MNQNISFMLALCKWPIALVFATFLPASIILLLNEIVWISKGADFFWPLLLGVTIYLLIWFVWIRKSSISFLSTLEHEITHCIFAWLTFNRVTGLRATLRAGGHMTFEGSGNWLLTISPYFFPTVTVILLLLDPFLYFLDKFIIQIIIGVSIAYHGTSTWSETNHTQSDLKEAGFFFSFLFLPTANLVSFSFIFANLRDGWNGMVNAKNYLLISYVNQLDFLIRNFD